MSVSLFAFFSNCRLEMAVEEIQIKLTYGTIAAKWWGAKNIRPIVLVHGWQDNAGTFDEIITLLPSAFSYLAIDLPGHGLSSRIPKGLFYHTSDIVHVLEEIRLKFKWKRISLLAHSLGAIVSFICSAMHADKVDLVCALDSIIPHVLDSGMAARWIAHRWLKSMEASHFDNENPPEYTYDQLVDRVHEGSFKSVDRNKAKYLIERGTKQSTINPDKYYFTRDIRVKFMHPLVLEIGIIIEFVKRVKAAYLYIQGTDITFSESLNHIDETTAMFKECNPKFEMLNVEGRHHLHLNNPELIADTISRFLIKYHIQEPNELEIITFSSKL